MNIKLLASLTLAAIETAACAHSAPSGLALTDPCTKFAGSLTGAQYNDAIDAAARDRHLGLRVLARDKEKFPATMDFRPDRVNVLLENGKVKNAFCG
jgi:hypothetical protein